MCLWCVWVNSDDYCDNGGFVAEPFTNTSQKMHLNTVTNVKLQIVQTAIHKGHEKMGVISKGFHTSLMGSSG